MKIFKHFFLIILLLQFVPQSLASNWRQGEAQMTIGNAPLDEVREQTIKNAIANATYKAGAMISAEDIVLNGLLVGSKVILQTQGVIRRAEVLNEAIDDDILTVRVKVDIAHTRECDSEKYSKKLLINQFRLMNPKQASIGRLFKIGQHVSKRVEQQFDIQSDRISILLLDHTFTKTNAIDSLNRNEITNKATYLQREYGYQYALFGIIRDIGLFNRVKDKEVTTRRSFTIRVYLLDIYNQAIVFEDSYHAEANWDFDIADTVDINSNVFWQSDYGRSVLETINNATIDVIDIINCSESVAQIISVIDDGYIINLGTQQGVKVGDNFNLNKTLRIVQNVGLTTNFIQNIPDSQMQVTATNNNTSIIRSKLVNNSISATLYDLVSPIGMQ